MRVSRIVSVFIALLTFVSVSTVQAEDRYEDRLEIGGQVGGLSVENDSKVDTGHLYSGARAGYYLNNDVAAEVAILAGQGDIKDNSANTDMILPSVELLYHFLGNNSARPFLAAGVGALVGDGPSPANKTNVTFPLGGGVKWMLCDNLGLRADARWIFDTEGGSETNKFSYTGGVTWLFDNKSEAAPVHVEHEEAQVMPEAAAVLKRDKVVSINLEVQFDFDKSDIKPQFEPRLKEFAAFMKQHPNTVAEIEGHTDNVGTKMYNAKLSIRRALAIRDYLVSNGHVAAARLNSNGYGFSRPVASNETDAGRAENRRVLGTVKIVE